MKRLHLLIKYTAICLSAAIAMLSASCVDRLLYDDESIPEGISTIDASVGFVAFTPALESRASGTAIKNINSLWLVIYKPDGTFIEKREVTGFDTEKLEPNTRPDGTPSSEQQTGHVNFKLTLNNGHYMMYAVANHDLSAVADDDIDTPAKLKALDLKWQTDDAAKNAQMFGWFVNGNEKTDYGNDAPIVTVGLGEPLHAWVRRAASKLTIAFDTRNLSENVYIYLKSVTVKDIPAHCYLHDDNIVGSDAYTLENKLIDGETIYFNKAEAADQGKVSYGKWATIAVGDSIFGLYSNANPSSSTLTSAERLALEHSEEAPALYFYENMQPDGIEGTVTDKRQDVSGANSQISYPDGTQENEYEKGWKDGKKWGSYVEVKAYYICNSDDNPGKGDITYRFMLGKDTKTNYEAERNHHYRLTMKFNRYANDVDFHIDYKEEGRPGLITPDTVYVSYTYNQPSSMTMRAIPAPGYELVDIESVIINNEWRPDKDPDGIYYNKTAWDQQVGGTNSFATTWVYSQAEEDAGNWNSYQFYKRDGEIEPNTEFGFLSLRSVEIVTQDFGRGCDPKTDFVRNIRRAYFTPHKNPNMHGDTRDVNGPLNWRRYDDIPQSDCTVAHSDEVDGDYTITRTTNPNSKEVVYLAHLPLYTRAKTLDTWAVYSGANQFYEHKRMARLKIKARYRYIASSNEDKILGDEYTDVGYTTVMQTERVDNPRAIYREYDNDDPFDIRLCYGRDNFIPVISEGPWTATIERDPHNLVRLTANNQTAEGEGSSITGHTRTAISFRYTPRGKLTSNTETRGAIINVTYHNNDCTHRILVRQGYAPQTLGVHGTTKWSTYNVYNDRELVRSPLSVGSLFRRYKDLSYPILERNNDDYGVGVIVGGKLKICNSGDTTWTLKAWDEIECVHRAEYSVDPEDAFQNLKLDNHNLNVSNDYRLPLYDELWQLGIVPTNSTNPNDGYANDYNVGYGIIYADGATTTQTDSKAYSYKDYGNKGTKSVCGVRGAVVYALSNGDNVPFPLGASGHARRKTRGCKPGGTAWGDYTSGYGYMRYGNVDYRLTGDVNSHRPLAWDLPSQMGAAYWINHQYRTEDNPNRLPIAIDFNYGNFMSYFLNMADIFVYYGGNNMVSDALPIRPVHDD